MIINKFNYIPLSRETINGQRKYATPDGEKLPSVTTILDNTKSEEKKKILLDWKKRVGAQKAQEITTEAANRGTRMHKFLEDYVKTGEISPSGTNPYSIQSHNMALNIIQNGLSKCTEFWGSEVPLYYPKIYAGTTDLVGVHENKECIMDFKQTNKIKKREWIEDYFIQLLFYGIAHNKVHGTNINKGVIFMCSADNIYQQFIIENEEWSFYENKMWERLENYYQKLAE